MGKCSQGVFGMWTKKVGNVVGRVVDGVNVYSIYQPNVSNPNTQAQQQTRSKFTLLTKYLSLGNNFAKMGVSRIRKSGTWLSLLIGRNFADGTTGSWPNYRIDPSKVKFAFGNVDNAYNTAAQVQGTDLSFSWTDNSGIGTALETDKFCFLVINDAKEAAIYDTEASDRSTRQASVSLPSSWTGDPIEVYAYFRRTNSDEVSDSLYLGNFQL